MIDGSGLAGHDEVFRETEGTAQPFDGGQRIPVPEGGDDRRTGVPGVDRFFTSGDA